MYNMFNVVLIIIKAIIIRFISVIQLIIIHFGMNPRNGGYRGQFCVLTDFI
jgi:hypothetical protein